MKKIAKKELNVNEKFAPQFERKNNVTIVNVAISGKSADKKMRELVKYKLKF